MSESAGSFSRLRVVRDGPVARVTLARPEVRNAFDEILIDSLTEAFLSFVDDPETRVVIWGRWLASNLSIVVVTVF